MQLSPHFTDEEFLIDQRHQYHGCIPRELLIALEFYREQIKAQLSVKSPELTFTGLTITSFARTPLYNQSVGGHINSHHLYDYTQRKEPDAVDFTTEFFQLYDHTKALTLMIEHMQTYNIFLSVGYYPKQHFIHINLENSIHDIKRWQS